MTLGFDDIPETALAWHRDGRGAALATVVQTWGSAPRGVGSQLAISGKGEISGSVSGGCVEGAVVVEAMEALETGKPVLLDYGVSDDEAFAVGLACGGEIKVLVEPIGAAIPEQMLADLTQARHSRKAAAYTVNTKTWQRNLMSPDDGFQARFRSDKSGFEEDQTFVAIHNPPLRMAVVGAVHIAQPLIAMARLAGYDPFLVDPREAFGSAERFPDETISHDWPDEALTVWGLDARTAVVTLTHDPKIDDPAIQTALASDCFYLGCLGSPRTHGKRVARLTEAGLSEHQISRIHGPVGLDIGSKTPAEIAIAVMAQITQVLRQG
ncbi:XdhC family protein [Actibacterium sp. 188UL27-1]|uniref:XdhC family protein n=1 Tax=Actibacterium sp. 188UL27-1 TaxID=2786961 RepID=UPI001956AAD6|nr:XdhC family protein [Actibacterium sp. 188UL27-1]MBM7066758.1 XdhC family protein [Actibacterium sp. 188UL27-1]